MSASRAALVVARKSRLNWQRPGTTLTDPLGTCNWPMVPTQVSATCSARFSTYKANSATAVAASRLRSMGVVPAWLAMPEISPTKRTLPLIEVTTPRGISSSFRTGPCSMCISTKPKYSSARRLSRGISAIFKPACCMAWRMLMPSASF